MYKIEWYPGVVPSTDEEDLVMGEVYKMKDREKVLSKLDRYEGCAPSDPKPHAFTRKQMPVRVEEEIINACIYLFELPVDDRVQIRSGDFLKYEG